MPTTYNFRIALPEEKVESHQGWCGPNRTCHYRGLENAGIFNEDESTWPPAPLIENVKKLSTKGPRAEGILFKCAIADGSELLWYLSNKSRTKIYSTLKPRRYHAVEATLVEHTDGSALRFYERFREDFNPLYQRALEEVLKEKGILKPRKRNTRNIPTA